MKHISNITWTQWRSQKFSIEGYDGGLGAEPPAIGGTWESQAKLSDTGDKGILGRIP